LARGLILLQNAEWWRAAHPHTVGDDDVLGQPRQDARGLPGRLDQERQQVRSQCRWNVYLCGPQRWHAPMPNLLRAPFKATVFASKPIQLHGPDNRYQRQYALLLDVLRMDVSEDLLP